MAMGFFTPGKNTKTKYFFVTYFFLKMENRIQTSIKVLYRELVPDRILN